jgi:DNA mismatch repair ATPase MutS
LKTASRSEVVFYLIDEIFRGTNNRERRIGAESVIRSLSETTAMGMVTTHDLDLSTLEGQVSGLSNHHFRDDVIDGKMMFTYEYRKGPCPSTNAIKVMRSAGLKVVEAGG